MKLPLYCNGDGINPQVYASGGVVLIVGFASLRFDFFTTRTQGKGRRECNNSQTIDLFFRITKHGWQYGTMNQNNESKKPGVFTSGLLG